ncbi:TPA: hypothetical protein DCZ90_01345 [Candidatus Amesbacteria bacterium]|nr:hypothetical protein [Candidatus Amesbacteria bacterium]
MTCIKHFYFDRAKYRVSDGRGNEIFMEIDYKNGKFELPVVNFGERKGMQELKRAVGKLAAGLIKRKRNVNFSAKIGV